MVTLGLLKPSLGLSLAPQSPDISNPPSLSTSAVPVFLASQVSQEKLLTHPKHPVLTSKAWGLPPRPGDSE